MDGKSVGVIFVPGNPCWKVYVDGAVNQRGSGVRLVLISHKKIIIEKSLRLGFSATNNEAEYEALLQGMAMVQKMGRKDSRDVLGLETSSRPSKGRVGGQRCKDARVPKPGQTLVAKL